MPCDGRHGPDALRDLGEIREFRDECLNMHWFSSGAEARVCIEQWRREYNEVRPHSSIAYFSPAAFVRQNRSTPNPGRGEAARY